MPWDSFMSHASEEKKVVAEPLTSELEDIGISVWIDKKQIQAGDRIYEIIDEGLRHARHGIVILSKAFFSKPWAKSELAALFTKESTGEIVLIPVLYDLSFQELAQLSPLLAGRLVIQWNEGVKAVAARIAAVVRGVKAEAPIRISRTDSFVEQMQEKDLVLIVSENVGTGFFEILDLRMDGTNLSIDVAPADGKEEGHLRNLSRDHYSNIMVAYGLVAHEVKICSFKEGRKSGRTAWTLDFRLQEKKTDFSDISYNGISPDKLAEYRARWILLGEKPSQPVGPGIMGDMFFESMIKGGASRLQIPAPPLPELYDALKTQPDRFMPYARLVAGMYLIQSNTAGNIHRLNLSLSGNYLSVDFEGERPQRFRNHNPETIAVVGSCNLVKQEDKKLPRRGIAPNLFK